MIHIVPNSWKRAVIVKENLQMPAVVLEKRVLPETGTREKPFLRT